ncbi:MAG: SprB repeat-containing protein, partial [Bacteroidota bacterium]
MKNIIILILCLTLCVVAKAQYLDCVDALPICSGGSLNYSSSGAGTDDFANTNNDNGCLLFGEHQSVWLVIKISQLSAPGANLGFTLTPNAAGGDDFDFAVYGPLSNCNNLGSPIRCSYANATLDNCGYCPQTGLGNGATDPIEGATGDGFVANLITYPSEVYYILIDNFSASYDGFSLEWTGNAELDCNLNCFANPGTFSLAGSANNETTNFPLQYTDNYVLCPGDGITFQTDENYVLPSAVGQEDASMLWALYTAPPPPSPSPNDAGFSGVLIDEDFITTINTAGTQSDLPAEVNLTNSTLWIVPVTGDDGNTNGNPNGTISIDADGDGCYVYGEPFAITYLEEIEVLPRTTCTELILKITNGMPAVFGGSYTISNFQPTYAQISNTTPGYEQDISVYNLNYGDSYSFDITDSNGCTSSFSGVFEYNGPRPDANATPNMSACPLEAITLNAWTYAWGTEFSYSWTGPGGFTSNQQNPTIPAIAGNYNVVVTVDGCESNPATTVVEVLDAPILDPIPDQANCSNSFDLSTINLTGTNLIGADFNYYADANGAPGNPITPIVVTSGTYWIEAIPTNNNLTCNGLQQVEVILGNITVTINSIQSVSCQGLADGAINTNISGGQAPFTFDWSGTDANTEDPEGLPPGLYTLTVTDALGCIGILEAQVPEVTAMDVQLLDISDPDCGTSTNGSISLGVTGGTAPHSIIWSNGATGFLNGQLGAGDYSYTITDANNCTLISTEAISLNAPSDLSISQTVVEPDCGNNAGSISIIVAGGSGNYSYTWPHDPTNTSNSANNLSSGPY